MIAKGVGASVGRIGKVVKRGKEEGVCGCE